MEERLIQWQIYADQHFDYDSEPGKFFNGLGGVTYRASTIRLNESEIITLVEVLIRGRNFIERFTFDATRDCVFHLESKRQKQQIQLTDRNLTRIMGAVFAELEKKILDQDYHLPFRSHVHFISQNWGTNNITAYAGR